MRGNQEAIKILDNELISFNDSYEPVINSTDLAEKLGKKHRDLLRVIRSLVENEFVPKNYFKYDTYVNSQNKQQPCFSIKFEGFLLLVMSFTGDKYIPIKLAVLHAFVEKQKESAFYLDCQKRRNKNKGFIRIGSGNFYNSAANDNRKCFYNNFAGVVYILKTTKAYKIGSTTNLDNRIKQLNTLFKYGFDRITDIYVSPYCTNYLENELILHSYFAEHRVEGTELFQIPNEIQDIIELSANQLVFKDESINMYSDSQKIV